MSDSSPEDFLQQALVLITQLKKALEASFTAQDKHIDKRIDAIIKVLGEQVATQQQSIDKNATDFTSLNKLFKGHTHSNYVSQSSMNDAIKAQTQSHDLKLEEIKSGYISVQEYNTQIQEFKNEIAALKKQIGNIPPPTTLSEEGKGAPKVTALPIPESRDVHPGNNTPLPEQSGETAHSDDSGENNTTREDSASSDRDNPLPDRSHQAGVAQPDQHTTPPSATSATIHAQNDPKVSDLKTSILRAIRDNEKYQSIQSSNRGRILKRANRCKSENPTVSEDLLHIQVILALYYLQSKPKSIPQDLYNMCYQNNPNGINTLQTIVNTFIDNNTLIVTGDIFKIAIKDSNFEKIITSGAVNGGDFPAIKTAIQTSPTGAKQ